MASFSVKTTSRRQTSSPTGKRRGGIPRRQGCRENGRRGVSRTRLPALQSCLLRGSYPPVVYTLGRLPTRGCCFGLGCFQARRRGTGHELREPGMRGRDDEVYIARK